MSRRGAGAARATLALGLLTVAGVAGICGAMIANLTPRAVHGTAMALLALANNLFGLAPGPLATGWISDHSNLLIALKLLPLPCLLALGAMMLAQGDYARAVAGK